MFNNKENSHARFAASGAKETLCSKVEHGPSPLTEVDIKRYEGVKYEELTLSTELARDNGGSTTKNHLTDLQSEGLVYAARKALKAAWSPKDESILKMMNDVCGNTCVALSVSIASIVALKHFFGIAAGNPGASVEDSILLADRVKDALLSIAVLPVIEEGLFRFVPSFLSDLASKGKSIGNNCIGVGIISTAIFGFAHNFIPGVAENAMSLGNGWSFSYELPLPQLILGACFWTQMRQHGIRGALFSHALVNSLPAALSLLGK